jgi:NADH-quinone oxidoreductase subunit I
MTQSNVPFGPKKVVGAPVARPNRHAGVQSYVPELAKGLAITMKHFFQNTKEMAFGQRNDPSIEAIDEGVNTVSYPEQRRPYPFRFRGVHRLTHRDDGSPRCVACLCCSTACPAQCIHIEAAESFVIDELRCVFCGFCVEACPCDAIRMDTGMHAAPYDSREQFIYEKDLLMGFPGRDGSHKTQNPRHEPGEPTHPGVDREHHH